MSRVQVPLATPITSRSRGDTPNRCKRLRTRFENTPNLNPNPRRAAVHTPVNEGSTCDEPCASLSVMPDRSSIQSRDSGIDRDDDYPPEQHRKNQAAVQLGRLGGRVGGQARAASLTPRRRSEIARTAARARWENSRS